MSGLFHWAGGKGRIVDALISHIVPNARHPTPSWIEPFVGGGAVALEAMRRSLASRYVLADGSADVMSVFETLRDEPAELMKELHEFAQLTEAEQRLIFAEQKPAYDQARRLQCARRLLILQAIQNGQLY
jgi:DNA adenine methylase